MSSLHRFAERRPPDHGGAVTDLRSYIVKIKPLLDNAASDPADAVYRDASEDEDDVVTFDVLRERNRQLAKDATSATRAEAEVVRSSLSGHRHRVTGAQKGVMAQKEAWRALERERLEWEFRVVSMHKQVEEEGDAAEVLTDEVTYWNDKEAAERKATLRLEMWVEQLDQDLVDATVAIKNQTYWHRLWNAACYKCFHSWCRGPEWWRLFGCCMEGRKWGLSCCRCGCYTEPAKEWKRRMGERHAVVQVRGIRGGEGGVRACWGAGGSGERCG